MAAPQDALIYVVEDDQDIAELVAQHLAREGYRVREFADGMSAYEAVLAHPPDLLILDLNLPSLSGIELCKYLRNQEVTEDLPIIMLTARSEEIDKIIGFEVGADDYLTKPFSVRELIARVKVHLRRTRKPTENIVRQGDLEINFQTYEVRKGNRSVQLTPIQFKLLKHLVQARGRVLSRQHLMDAIWGQDYHGDSRTVDVHITRLREKIDPEARWIVTVKGIGYRWKWDE